ncbi:aspartyl protease family protein [Paucihalobacter sp.]|uniref:aspartyl protease family protein n=1 Tax=Paucihalobacter sp. TaxID=2850405 RepID=UPI003D161BEB
MKNFKTLFTFLFFGIFAASCSGQIRTTFVEPNKIFFEKTDYGLIFTNIRVNDKDVKAMIDFGDQHKLQLSSTLIDQLNIETEKAGYQVSDVYGNNWDVKNGTAQKLVVGTCEENNVEFSSQDGEMESVSQQIGTEFNAVLGWGYFKKYHTEIDYSASLFTLYDGKITIENEVFSVQFQKEANQLIIPAIIDNHKVNFMIDTGSPVTVVDSLELQKIDNQDFVFSIGGEEFKIKAYPQDLSVLADLGIKCILGGDFLKNWKIIIDPEHNVLHFKK